MFLLGGELKQSYNVVVRSMSEKLAYAMSTATIGQSLDEDWICLQCKK